MYFKRLISAVLLGPLVLCGCGLKIGEKAPEEPPVSYSGKNYTCVSQIPQHIQKYLNDELNDTQITDFVRCLQNAFSSFAQYTRGRETSNYRADEIRNFLQKSFIRDRTISDELLHEFMVIKQTLVGGDESRIQRSELFDAVGFLEDLRVEAIRLRPHIRVLNPRLAEKEDSLDLGQRLAEANAALKLSIQSVAKHLEKSKKDYSLANLESFLTEFREFVHWEDQFPEAKPVPKWIALLRAFKEATVSPSEPDIIRESDWVPLLQSTSNWYLAYLQYQIGIKKRPVLYGAGLQNAVYLANYAIMLIRDAVKSQGGPTPTLTFTQISHVLNAMRNVGWIPENIRPESMDQAVRAMVTRVGGEATTKPSLRRARGLDYKSLAVLDGEFQRWAYVQTNLDKRYRGGSDVAEPLPVPNLHSPMGLSPDVFSRLEQMSGSEWDEFIKIKNLMRPLFLEDRPRVVILPPAEASQIGLHHDFYNLSMMNLLRSIVGLVFRGYAETSESPWLWSSGIKGPELQTFYVDFRNVGIDLNMVDKRNVNSGSRAFVEGKLFTSSSQGLDYRVEAPDRGELSFVEAMEYFAYLYSGGMMAKDIYANLDQVNCPDDPKDPAPKDINDQRKLSRKCVLANLPAMIAKYMVNMPNLKNFAAHLPPNLMQNYTKIMLDTARQPDYSEEKWVEKNELSTMAVVAHYTESIMTRFDVNLDGKLDSAELSGAVPLFSGFIKKISHDMKRDLSDREARAALFYILSHRKMPQDVLWDKLVVITFEFFEPTLVLDRMELAQVFQAIIARLFEVGRKPLPLPTIPMSATMPSPKF